MSDDNSDRSNLSRRKALAGLGGIGAAAAFGGYGTLAAFNDDENVRTTVTAGELDLKLDYLNYYNDQLLDGSGSYEGSISDDVNAKAQVEPGQTDGELILNLQDVKPGDSGCTVISIHMDPDDGNPAFVWMQADHTASENGTNEAEESSDDEVDGEVELLDALHVNTFYDDTYDCEFNNPDSFGDMAITAETAADFEDQGYQTPFRTLTDSGIASDKGILLDGVRGTGALTRASEEPKWLSPFFPTPEDAVAELEVDGRSSTASKVATSASDLESLDGNEVYAGNPSGFATSPVDETDQPAGTQYVAFQWEIPFDTGNEIQSDSVSIDLKLHAQQARHNATPLSPFNDSADDADREPNYPIDLAPEVDSADYHGSPY